MEKLTIRLDRIYEIYNRTKKDSYKKKWYSLLEEVEKKIYFSNGRKKYI